MDSKTYMIQEVYTAQQSTNESPTRRKIEVFLCSVSCSLDVKLACGCVRSWSASVELLGWQQEQAAAADRSLCCEREPGGMTDEKRRRNEREEEEEEKKEREKKKCVERKRELLYP